MIKVVKKSIIFNHNKKVHTFYAETLKCSLNYHNLENIQNIL